VTNKVYIFFVVVVENGGCGCSKRGGLLTLVAALLDLDDLISFQKHPG